MTEAPAVRGRVPFTLLGGYLGAGKTTFLNRLLATTSRRIVVLVNDVGAVGVDAALIAEHDGSTLSLTNGCVCCAFGDDLAVALERVRSMSPPPDHVVMELSGVGEPARIAPWAATAGFRLDGIVVLADADQIAELVERRYVGDTIRNQLAAADLVLLSKTDLVVDATAARGVIAAASNAPVQDALAVDPGSVLGTGARVAPPMPSGDDRHVVSTLAAAGLTRRRLQALVDGLGPDVVRAKGLVRCTDVADVVEVHVVGRRRVLRDRPDLSGGVDLDDVVDALVVITAPAGPTDG